MRREFGAWRRRLARLFLPYPGQALTLGLLTGVLATVLVSAPLMLRSAEQGAWEQDRLQLSREVLGLTLHSVATDNESAATTVNAQIDKVTSTLTRSGQGLGLGDPMFSTRLDDRIGATGPGGHSDAQMASRTGAADHVHILAGGPSRTGVLIPRSLAEDTGAGPGDRLTLGEPYEPGGKASRARVSGVYETITSPLPPFWQGESALFLPQPGPAGPAVLPPPAILAPFDVMVQVTRNLSHDLLLKWAFLPPPDIGVAEAQRRAGVYEELKLQLGDPKTGAADLFEAVGTKPDYRTSLPNVLESTTKTVALLRPPVRAVGVGGVAAALVLVGAWAGLRARRRRSELRALVARGLSPTRAAAQVAGEAVLPVLLGLAAGGALAWFLVLLLGPGSRLPSGAGEAAVLTLLAGGTAVVVAAGVVTAGAVMRLDQVDQGPFAQLAGRVPWLSVATTVTVLAAIPLFTASVGSQVTVLELVVPLLVVAVVAGAFMRILQRAAPAAAGLVSRLPTGPFLAVRRVLAAPGSTRLIVITTALAVGLVVYAGALAGSTSRTVAAKAAIATGSDVVVDFGTQHMLPKSLPENATAVDVDHDLSLEPGKGRVDLLAVRHRQLDGVISWSGSFADQPLDELMGALTRYDGPRVPAVFAGDVPPHLLQASHGKVTITDGYYRVPIKVVALAHAFPGMSSRQPMLVADRARFERALHHFDPSLTAAKQVWARGDSDAVLAELAAAGAHIKADLDDFTRASPLHVVTAAEFANRPGLRAQTWALGYLRAMALAAVVLGLVGLALHAASQQRRRTVATLLLARMGLTRRAADAASALEIALTGGLATLIGIGCALPASALVLTLLDPVPELPPDPLFVVPAITVGAVVAGVLVTAWLGAIAVGHAARRASGGQVLRDAP